MENRQSEDIGVAERYFDAIVLSDGKAGHVNQSLGVIQRLPMCHPRWVNVKFRGKRHDNFMRLLICLFGGFRLPNWLIKRFLHIGLQSETLHEILALKRADFILSTGSSVASINLLLGQFLGAKNVTCRRPSPMGAIYFDLAILPQENWPRREKKHVCKTIGVPNSISEDKLNARRRQLRTELNLPNRPRIGVLIGGEDRYDTITEHTATRLIDDLEAVCGKLDCQILLTTSRRTPSGVATLISQRLSDSDLCPILVAADRESPISNPVEGILALSDVILVTEDSFSMVCEAASSGRHAFIVPVDHRTRRRPKRHRVYADIISRASVGWYSVEALDRHIRHAPIEPVPVNSLCDTEVAASAVAHMLGLSLEIGVSTR
ncbi:MAG: ELM1/GtrOC1 family putative glycosyltransferase [Candidatus Poribacteria bacterium]|nr:ELM1/GtrOC1 family putative glycosyltransferase [Candidatus Poribacteria bacterium]MDE0505507.1 ELM1/GtrOC1 family putative glycosyltransferase [Candidatus Poribacteria bacterium]